MAQAAETFERGTKLEDLYRREWAGLHRMCTAILGNANDAEDAVHEAFARVAPRMHLLEGEPGAYLRVVARRVCSEFRSVRRHIVEAGEIDQRVDDGPENLALERERLNLAWASLSALDRKLILGSFAGYSLRDMATQVGMSANVVAVTIHRARKRARRTVEALPSLVPWTGGQRWRFNPARRVLDRVGSWLERLPLAVVEPLLAAALVPLTATVLVLAGGSAATTATHLAVSSPITMHAWPDTEHPNSHRFSAIQQVSVRRSSPEATPMLIDHVATVWVVHHRGPMNTDIPVPGSPGGEDCEYQQVMAISALARETLGLQSPPGTCAEPVTLRYPAPGGSSTFPNS